MADDVTDDVTVITGPRVYVLGRPWVNETGMGRYLSAQGVPGWSSDAPNDAQFLTEVAARSCYRSFGRGRPHDGHVAHLIEAGHLSTFEHGSWTLGVTGVSRTLTHELVRHRHLSPSQESQRYVDAADVAFVCPPLMLPLKEAWEELGRKGPEGHPNLGAAVYADWLAGNRHARDRYRRQCDGLRFLYPGLSAKEVREAARSVLPGCVETRIVLSGNARAWRHVLGLRLAAGADAEMRRLARLILDTLEPEAPGLFAGLGG